MRTGIHGSNSWATLEAITLTSAPSLATHNQLALAVDSFPVLRLQYNSYAEYRTCCKNYKSENRFYINDWNNESK